ncbi:hypothetical protein CGRA01v4_04962 [Colletotrichum graminicola]|nr:hypothetical protein CGRA01v4_04962 [Colletotrichum graminicola]
MCIAILFAMWIRVRRHTCVFMHWFPQAQAKKKSQSANRSSDGSSMFRTGILPHPREPISQDAHVFFR